MRKKQELTKEEKKNLKKFGDRLKYFRTKAGFSNYEHFAYEHELNRTQYGGYEAGKNIEFITLTRILKAMNVTFEEFFNGFD
jgi:transcriptional regulator with XRE-family HTH domain